MNIQGSEHEYQQESWRNLVVDSFSIEETNEKKNPQLFYMTMNMNSNHISAFQSVFSNAEKSRESDERARGRRNQMTDDVVMKTPKKK